MASNVLEFEGEDLYTQEPTEAGVVKPYMIESIRTWLPINGRENESDECDNAREEAGLKSTTYRAEQVGIHNKCYNPGTILNCIFYA